MKCDQCTTTCLMIPGCPNNRIVKHKENQAATKMLEFEQIIEQVKHNPNENLNDRYLELVIKGYNLGVQNSAEAANVIITHQQFKTPLYQTTCKSYEAGGFVTYVDKQSILQLIIKP